MPEEVRSHQLEVTIAGEAQPRRRRALRGALIAGATAALALGGVGIAAATTTSTAAPPKPSGAPDGRTPPMFVPGASSNGPPTGRGFFGGGPGPGGGPGGQGASPAVAGGGLNGPAGTGQQVSAITGSTITVTGPGSKSTTYQTDSSTTYTVDGIPASASDVHVGDHVTVRAPFTGGHFGGPKGSTTTTTTAPTTPTALSVNVVLPQLSGQVHSIGPGQFVLVDPQGFWRTVNTSGSTTYLQSGVGATSSALTVGSQVQAAGTIDADHTSLDASWVNVQLPTVGGRVTAVSGSTITLSTFNSTTVTVHTSGSTHFTSGSGAGSISDVKVGDMVSASGAKAADGSISAVKVNVSTGGPSGGRPGWGGPGHPAPPNGPSAGGPPTST